MIEFFLDSRSGTSPYLQLVEQVRRALRLNTLRVGDQLPTIKEVVGTIAINPNTVLKAYRQLENEGLIQTRPGIGTFVVQSLASPRADRLPGLGSELLAWIEKAREAGLDEESIIAVFEATRRESLAVGAR
jgi:GntR family transcriptional regulator